MLNHHRGRLHDRGGRHPLPETELLDRVTRHDRDEADRVAHHHLDLGHQALDLDVGDDRVKAVTGAQVRRAGLAAQAVDLARRHHAAVALVALGPDPTLPVPAAERVDADPERLRSLADAVCTPSALASLSSLVKPHRRGPINPNYLCKT